MPLTSQALPGSLSSQVCVALCSASSLIRRCISSFPPLFRLGRWTGLNHSSAGGRRGSGDSYHACGDARPDRAVACIDCYAGFARARYIYQPHTMRALRAVAYLTNALQVRREMLGRPVQTLIRCFLAFCFWLGCMYLMAMIGLLALVIATSRIPCVPYGLWPTLQMQCR